MESSSLFSDGFESVPVSCFLESSRQQLVVLHSAVWGCAVPCLSPGAFQDTLCPYPECSVLGLQPWAVENVCLQVWHWVEKALSRRFNHTGSVGTPGLTLE